MHTFIDRSVGERGDKNIAFIFFLLVYHAYNLLHNCDVLISYRMFLLLDVRALNRYVKDEGPLISTELRMRMNIRNVL